VDAIREILKGISRKVWKISKGDDGISSKHAFWRSAEDKEKIEVLENYQSRSTIVNPKSPISMCSQLFLMKVPLMWIF
jgi:excinuclease ABC subunit C